MNTSQKIIAALAVAAALYLIKHRKPVQTAATVDPQQAQTAAAIQSWQTGVVAQAQQFSTSMTDSQQHLTA
jgi:hypothetical protein